MTSARLHLTFPPRLMTEPILHRLTGDFPLVTNIRRANLEEDRGGWVIVEVEGPPDAIADAIVWLAGQGLEVERLEA